MNVKYPINVNKQQNRKQPEIITPIKPFWDNISLSELLNGKNDVVGMFVGEKLGAFELCIIKTLTKLGVRAVTFWKSFNNLGLLEFRRIFTKVPEETLLSIDTFKKLIASELFWNPIDWIVNFTTYSIFIDFIELWAEICKRRLVNLRVLFKSTILVITIELLLIPRAWATDFVKEICADEEDKKSEDESPERG